MRAKGRAKCARAIEKEIPSEWVRTTINRRLDFSWCLNLSSFIIHTLLYYHLIIFYFILPLRVPLHAPSSSAARPLSFAIQIAIRWHRNIAISHKSTSNIYAIHVWRFVFSDNLILYVYLVWAYSASRSLCRSRQFMPLLFWLRGHSHTESQTHTQPCKPYTSLKSFRFVIHFFYRTVPSSNTFAFIFLLASILFCSWDIYRMISCVAICKRRRISDTIADDECESETGNAE